MVIGIADMTTEDDLGALMRRARAGDQDAYRRLLARAAVWLRGIVRRGLVRVGRGDAECEDIVQETLLAMHLKRQTWDPAQPLEPWLRAVAHHKLVDHLRRRGFAPHVDIDDLADTLAAPEGTDPTDAGDAQRLLAMLPARQRAVVEAISLEGRSAREAGAKLGISEGAARVTLHRALKALATAWRRMADGASP